MGWMRGGGLRLGMRRWFEEALLVWQGPDWCLIVSLAGE
jgi:hypothetical protein